MAQVINGITYDEDEYPIDAWGVRTGPRRNPKDSLPPGAVGGGGGQGMMGGGGGAPAQMQMPDAGTIFSIGSPSSANPMLGKRNPAIEGLTLAMQKPRNY